MAGEVERLFDPARHRELIYVLLQHGSATERSGTAAMMGVSDTLHEEIVVYSRNIDGIPVLRPPLRPDGIASHAHIKTQTRKAAVHCPLIIQDGHKSPANSSGGARWWLYTTTAHSALQVRMDNLVSFNI
ncbi:hypothetical protein E2C01_041502 [Portunus trituberculatus]|uniref:Uncharacterized protein n=1 Tax=Portunus trituberculatus TaxID=210409 RepID=A0A5B7FQK1_PORTR|nr:hypothetical protein [Portunus trituberculatus]